MTLTFARQTRTSPRAPQDSAQPVAISFSAIISALTFAIDLTEGAVPGHAVRTCILGMRIAQAGGVAQPQLAALYRALLLKDVGCSSNAALLTQIVGGDDRAVKNGVKLEDWTRPHRPSFEGLRLLWNQVLPHASALRRMGRIGRIALSQRRNNEEMIALRCERGASIAQKLGLSSETAAAIYSLDEHWDGSGYPHHRSGSSIPVLARIVAIAQHLDFFASERSPEVAIRVLRARSGRWFDPHLVRAVLDLCDRGQLWAGCLSSDNLDLARQLVLDLEPRQASGLRQDGVGPDEVDRICEAFADVVDAKSPFTYRHSLGVAEVATALAEALRLPTERQVLVRRAALLHDLGKLAISNTILDKSGQLTPAEWEAIVEHPRLTREILQRIEPFAELADIAGAHHEKLDGSGYPNKLTAAQLSIEARIIAVADIYQALTELRPYRAGISHGEAMEILRGLTPHAIDLTCVNALDALHHSDRRRPSPDHTQPQRLRHLATATA